MTFPRVITSCVKKNWTEPLIQGNIQNPRLLVNNSSPTLSEAVEGGNKYKEPSELRRRTGEKVLEKVKKFSKASQKNK